MVANEEKYLDEGYGSTGNSHYAKGLGQDGEMRKTYR